MMQGLSSAEVLIQQGKFGPNILETANTNPWWKMLFSQFTDFMVLLLIAAAGVAIGMGYYEGDDTELIDGYIILGIVLLNAGIGFFQEFKTDRALEALKKLVSHFALVIRNGEKVQIKAEEVVPGEIIVLNAGDKIVADGFVLESSRLTADEAALTGESTSVFKRMDEKLFMGTSIVGGAGVMEVTHIGMATEFGKIASLTTQTVQDKSPLQKELYSIGVFVTKVTIALSLILMLVGIFLQGKHFLESLLFAVSVAVAAVPEGLPATITIALALGGAELVRKNVVVKKLSSIETLGATTVICSDKTGTLTKNEMTVTRVVLGVDEVLEVTGAGYDPGRGDISPQPSLLGWREGARIIPPPTPSAAVERKGLRGRSSNLQMIRQISTYCTEAVLQNKDGHWTILGDPTEGALLTFSQKKVQGETSAAAIPEFQITEKIPFDSDRKLMSVVVLPPPVKEGGQGGGLLLTKGAPDRVIERSTQILVNGSIQEFTSELKKNAHAMNEALARDALRVIGFGYRILPQGPPNPLARGSSTVQEPERDLIFVGMVGMIDPPREEVPKAVELCRKAGVRILVITGDHGLTAHAIAKQIGMADEQTPVILGKGLEGMTDKELERVLGRTRGSIIFSRVSPEHKRRIVDRLKEMGEVVAVTGDGVNDAPALKRADLGIAMGITGTEVAKETANMILMNDSFASIIVAIREGRKIYANLKKFTWFIFSTNIGELVLVFSAILLNIPAPLTAALILAINVGTDVLPAIALGVDHAEPDIMEMAPRDPAARIMNRAFVKHFTLMGLFIGFIALGGFYWKISTLGSEAGLHEAQTFAFTMLVVMELFNAYSARSTTHSIFKLQSFWKLTAANLISLAIVLAIISIPALQKIFHTVSLPPADWLIIGAAGVLIVGVEEVAKQAFRSGAKPPKAGCEA